MGQVPRPALRQRFQESVNEPPHPPPRSAAAGDHRTLPTRLAILGGLVILELLAISIWLDAELLRGRGALANLVHDWGAWTVRLSVAIVLGSLIFAESRAKTNLERISSACAASRIAWPLLAAHLAGSVYRGAVLAPVPASCLQ